MNCTHVLAGQITCWCMCNLPGLYAHSRPADDRRYARPHRSSGDHWPPDSDGGRLHAGERTAARTQQRRHPTHSSATPPAPPPPMLLPQCGHPHCFVPIAHRRKGHQTQALAQGAAQEGPHAEETEESACEAYAAHCGILGLGLMLAVSLGDKRAMRVSAGQGAWSSRWLPCYPAHRWWVVSDGWPHLAHFATSAKPPPASPIASPPTPVAVFSI